MVIRMEDRHMPGRKRGPKTAAGRIGWDRGLTFIVVGVPCFIAAVGHLHGGWAIVGSGAGALLFARGCLDLRADW
jgi:hypothetical protein